MVIRHHDADDRTHHRPCSVPPVAQGDADDAEDAGPDVCLEQGLADPVGRSLNEAGRDRPSLRFDSDGPQGRPKQVDRPCCEEEWTSERWDGNQARSSLVTSAATQLTTSSAVLAAPGRKKKSVAIPTIVALKL